MKTPLYLSLAIDDFFLEKIAAEAVCDALCAREEHADIDEVEFIENMRETRFYTRLDFDKFLSHHGYTLTPFAKQLEVQCDAVRQDGLYRYIPKMYEAARLGVQVTSVNCTTMMNKYHDKFVADSEFVQQCIDDHLDGVRNS